MSVRIRRRRLRRNIRWLSGMMQRSLETTLRAATQPLRHDEAGYKFLEQAMHEAWDSLPQEAKDRLLAPTAEDLAAVETAVFRHPFKPFLDE